MDNLYWWSRYGDFSPGEGILPHMGEVIAEYRRRRGYDTQGTFAIAAGVSLRTVQEWETTIMTHDHERRKFLAKMLKIPPALLGLDWRLVFYQDSKGAHPDPFAPIVEHVEEDAFYAYEDILIMGWESLRKGSTPDIAERLDRRLRKLR